jgi:hypothetical protein
VTDMPPRWRIRRNRNGRWQVKLRTAGGKGTYFYALIVTYDTWAAALRYVERAQRANYGAATPPAA